MSVPGPRPDGPGIAARLQAQGPGVVPAASTVPTAAEERAALVAHARRVVAGGSEVSQAAGVLAHVVRGDLVESVHTGHLVVLGPDGQVRLSVGDSEVTVLPRSCLKPLQAVGMLRAGLDVMSPTAEQLALACASHNGEEEHLRVVRELLAGAGLDERALDNTPDWPIDPQAAYDRRAAGHGPEPITQNCSGKHAAMLSTCVAHVDEPGWETDTYREPEHPLQQTLHAAVEELTGWPVEHVTVDGCGAPLFSTTLRGLARAFSRIARAGAAVLDPETGVDAAAVPEARVALAMRSYPQLVGGTGRDVTAAMQAVPGLVAKDGADGVYAAGLPDGSALAFKVADGGGRPRPAVLVAALRAAGAHLLPGVDVAALDELGVVPVLGHGEPVGAVVPAFAVAEAPGDAGAGDRA